MKNILIIRLSSIGDILLTTPFIRQVKKKFSNSTIHYIIKKEFSPLLKQNPNIDKLIEFDDKNGIKELIEHNKKLRSIEFDYIFDLHNNIRSNRLTAAVNSKYIKRMKKNKFRRFLLVYLKINLYNKIQSISEKYLKTGEQAGVIDDKEGLDLFFSKEELFDHSKRIEKLKIVDNDYIAIAPGATYYTKRWPLHYLAELIEKLKKEKIVILGSKQEIYNHAKFSEFSNVINLTGKLSIIQSALMIKSSKLFISNDSGLMHIASALKKKQIAIFGSTVKELGFFPYKADAEILEKRLWCRPCSHVGRNSCPLVHFKCMRSISVDQVLSTLKQFA